MSLVGKNHERLANERVNENQNDHALIDVDMLSSHISSKNITYSRSFSNRLKQNKKEKEL